MLELNGLYKVFNAGTVNEKRAIDGLDLTLEEGDFVTVIGGNGAGKSTTLNLIAGVFPADRGTIRLNGVDITRLPEHKRAKYLGRVFQDPMMGTAATMGIEETWRWPTAGANPVDSAQVLPARSGISSGRSWPPWAWAWKTA